MALKVITGLIYISEGVLLVDNYSLNVSYAKFDIGGGALIPFSSKSNLFEGGLFISNGSLKYNKDDFDFTKRVYKIKEGNLKIINGKLKINQWFFRVGSGNLRIIELNLINRFDSFSVDYLHDNLGEVVLILL